MKAFSSTGLVVLTGMIELLVFAAQAFAVPIPFKNRGSARTSFRSRG